jgi:hypothetical protein
MEAKREADWQQDVIPHKRPWDPLQSTMADLLDNYPVEQNEPVSDRALLQNLQSQVHEIQKKLDSKPRPTRKVTLVSLDAKIDLLIKILTDGQQ